MPRPAALGLRHVWALKTTEEIDSAVVTRVRMFNDLRDATGPFDVIGDVHGCLAELGELLARLGYSGEHDAAGRLTGASHPHGRTAVFLGDLVDRGPDTPGVLSMVMRMTAAGHALAVAGNHEAKLLRALRGRDVSLSHGLAGSLGQIEAREAEQPGFRAAAERFLDGLVSHYVLDGGRLVVAHAGLKEAFHGRASGRVRAFALYGDTTGRRMSSACPFGIRGPMITGAGHGAVRAHAAARTRMGQQHHVPGHRLRLRRPADRAALSGTRAGLGPGPPRGALASAGVFDELASGWVLLDAELLPWSAKAEDLVRVQYATVGLRGLVQPGLKVRGRDYLRIIYRPDYTDAANLDRLRARGLGVKRSLAAREYALGLEGLGRLVAGEPLWRVHECVFAVLALESEPVDPRL